MSNSNSIYTNRKTIQLRKDNPLVRFLGTVDPAKCLDYIVHAKDWGLQDTLQLRTNNGIDYDVSKLQSYNHSNIQYTTDPEPETINYNCVYPEYQLLVNDIQTTIGNTYRMRWAKLNGGEVLDWHMDPPTGDRFIIVVRGSHEVQFDVKGKIVSQQMGPGEIWYINSNWYHRVINNSLDDRYAILGCFDINSSI